MLRHCLTANITDPVSDQVRGNSIHTLYFSGFGALVDTQVNYLDRKIVTNGFFKVYVNTGTVAIPVWTEKTVGVDYTISEDNLTVTWIYNPVNDFNDNIKIVYSSINQWIYDDNPRYDIAPGLWPRITVEEVNYIYETQQIGSYGDYLGGKGDLVTSSFRIIVRYRRQPKDREFILDNIRYKNSEVMNAVAESVKTYIKVNTVNPPWLFYMWELENIERINSEQDLQIYRKDLTLDVTYFDVGETVC